MCHFGSPKIIMFISFGAIIMVGVAFLVTFTYVGATQIPKMRVLNELIEHRGLDTSPPHAAGLGFVFIGTFTFVAGSLFILCFIFCKPKTSYIMSIFIGGVISFMFNMAASILLLAFPQPYSLQDYSHVAAFNIEWNYGYYGEMAKGLNYTMYKMKCCGYNNYTDFTDNWYINRTGLYPPWCCYEDTKNCTAPEAATAAISGCSLKLSILFSNNGLIIGAVSLGISAVEFVAVVGSMYVIKTAGYSISLAT